MKSFRASSANDLLETLENIPVPVPPRSEGRENDHTENWVACHFLAGIAESDLFEYHLCVEPRERPDLVLSSQSGKTGIEITEAIHEEAAEADVHSKPEEKYDILPVPHYRIGEKRSLEERKNIPIARERTQRLPHMGDSIERNWIEAMVHFTKRKAGKFASLGFGKHDRNWLLIYDNWSPGVHGYHDVATPLSRQLFDWEWKNPFEKVFILANPHTLENHYVVWEFSRNAEIIKHHVPDRYSYSVQLASRREFKGKPAMPC